MARTWAFRGLLVALVVVAVGCKLTITPTTGDGWVFANEGANGTGHFTNGPGTPPSGRGSALLTVDGTGREDVATLDYQGKALSTLTTLTYSTYQAFSGSPQDTPTLQFDVDYDSTDGNSTYQGRLVFVPAEGGTITPGAWQTWDTLTGADGGAWYSTGSGSSAYRPILGGVIQSSPPCTQASYCSWSQVMTDYPNAQIRPQIGVLLVRAGGPVTNGASEATDNVTVGVNNVDITYDFGPSTGATVVNPTTATAQDFAFVAETPNGSGSFVSGPAGADGSGSAQLTVDSNGGEAIETGVFAGTALSRLTDLSYETYLQAAGPNAPTLQFDTDYDSTDGDNTYQGRLVFEPSLSGGAAVTDSTWQTWNPLTATSGWWQTGNPIVGGVTGSPVCTQGAPCSWATITSTYPNAEIRPIVGQVAGIPNDGRLWLKAGGGWPGGFVGNVDDLTVGIDNQNVTYNFEP